MREIEDALQNAERSGDDFALTFARMALGFALVHRHTAAERDRGQNLLAEVSDVLHRRVAEVLHDAAPAGDLTYRSRGRDRVVVIAIDVEGLCLWCLQAAPGKAGM